VEVLAWELRDMSYRLEPGGMVRFRRRLNDEAGRAWNRAIERTAADLLGPGGNRLGSSVRLKLSPGWCCRSRAGRRRP
jgi:hypothetical protein